MKQVVAGRPGVARQKTGLVEFAAQRGNATLQTPALRMRIV